MKKRIYIRRDEKFVEFYNSIKDELFELEQLRKEVLKTRIATHVVTPALAFVFAGILTLMLRFFTTVEQTGEAPTIGLLTVIFLFSWVMFGVRVRRFFVKYFKLNMTPYKNANIIKKIFEFIFSTYSKQEEQKDDLTQQLAKFLEDNYICQDKEVIRFVVIIFAMLYQITYLINPAHTITPTLNTIICTGIIMLFIAEIIYIIYVINHNDPKEIPIFRYGFLGFFSRMGMLDDHYNGLYKDLAVRLQEIKYFPFTRVVMLDFKSPKNVNASITITNKKFKYPKQTGEAVALEDAELARKYTITATKRRSFNCNIQIEARRLLTPSFMEKLKILDNKGIIVSCCFHRGNVYIMMKAKKNMFEFPLFSNVILDESYLSPIMDVKEVLSIIDTLKLDQEGI